MSFFKPNFNGGSILAIEIANKFLAIQDLQRERERERWREVTGEGELAAASLAGSYLSRSGSETTAISDGIFTSLSQFVDQLMIRFVRSESVSAQDDEQSRARWNCTRQRRFWITLPQ